MKEEWERFGRRVSINGWFTKAYQATRKLVNQLIYVSVLVCFWANDANAYFDPGTGSMILQALLAFFIGIGLAFYKVRVKVWSLIERAIAKVVGRKKEE